MGQLIEFSSPTPAPLTALQEQLIVDHIHLVKRIARSVGSRVPACFDIDDLEGPGYLALVKAARGFDERREPGDVRTVRERFAAYARRWIEGAIKESVRRRNWREATQLHVEDLTDPHQQFADTRERPDEMLLAKEVAAEVRREIQDWLPARERIVIDVHYSRERNLATAGRRLGVSQSRAVQLHRKALRTLEPRLRLVA